jgi:V8-like Glu-specific endopeptidase
MRKSLLYIFVFGFVFGLVTIPAHAEEITLSSGDLIISHAVNSSPSDWTEEEAIKAATAPSPSPPKAGEVPPAKDIKIAKQGPPVSWPANDPDNNSVPNLGNSETLGTSAACPASPYDWGWVGDHTEYPYRVTGKLIFRTSEGVGQCSASLINPKLVITAAHCVALGGGWYSGFNFIPAFKDGSMPYGQYGVRDIWVFKTWMNNGDFSRDVAVIFLHDDLGNRIGHLGFISNIDPNQTWSQIGYPSEMGPGGEPFDGTDQVWSRSGLGYYYADCDPPQLATGTLMTHGSSGGPWVLWENMYVNGVVSRGGLNNCQYMSTTSYFDYLIGLMVLTARDAQ